jgi:hypothetical protein
MAKATSSTATSLRDFFILIFSSLAAFVTAQEH